MPMRILGLAALALLVVGCSSDEPRARRDRDSSLPRSSIVAVLQRQVELGLTADQVSRLQALDDELARTNGELLDERKTPATDPRAGQDADSGDHSGGGGHRGGGRRGMGGRPRTASSANQELRTR